MGAYASINKERYPGIYLQGKDTCCRKSSYSTLSSFPFEDKPSVLPPGYLWDQFGSEVNKHLTEINKGLLCHVLLFILLALICIAAGILLIILPNDPSKLAAIPFSCIPVVIVALYYYLGRFSIRNDRFDTEIRRVCTEYDAEFRRCTGHVPEYRTKWTNLMPMPKNNARTQRLIVFKPARAVAVPKNPLTNKKQRNSVGSSVGSSTVSSAGSTEQNKAPPKTPKPNERQKRDRKLLLGDIQKRRVTPIPTPRRSVPMTPISKAKTDKDRVQMLQDIQKRRSTPMQHRRVIPKTPKQNRMLLLRDIEKRRSTTRPSDDAPTYPGPKLKKKEDRVLLLREIQNQHVTRVARVGFDGKATAAQPTSKPRDRAYSQSSTPGRKRSKDMKWESYKNSEQKNANCGIAAGSSHGVECLSPSLIKPHQRSRATADAPKSPNDALKAVTDELARMRSVLSSLNKEDSDYDSDGSDDSREWCRSQINILERHLQKRNQDRWENSKAKGLNVAAPTYERILTASTHNSSCKASRNTI